MSSYEKDIEIAKAKFDAEVEGPLRDKQIAVNKASATEQRLKIRAELTEKGSEEWKAYNKFTPLVERARKRLKEAEQSYVQQFKDHTDELDRLKRASNRKIKTDLHPTTTAMRF